MPTDLVELENISKSYTVGPGRLPVLRHVNLVVQRGEFVAVMGPSGSGKSTLLHILGCLDRPDAGSYRLDGQSMLAATDAALSQIRARQIGFVFQTFNLIHTLTVYENIELPFIYSAASNGNAKAFVRAAIEQVGLSERIAHKPSQLSGGEMQRAAIARAVAPGPQLILADEPTGNLDSATGGEILDLFETLNAGGATIVMVTHNKDVAARAGKVMVLHDGRLS
jgi:putative ABC transport system ATP-binding protein